MKQVIVVSVSALALLAGPSVAAYAARPSTSPGSDTATVCDVSGATVVKGLTAFTQELDKAGASATSGDLAAADSSLKVSGAMLIDLAGKLRKDVETAQSAELRQAVEEVAKEMEIQGGNLSGGPSTLRNFSTQGIEDLSERVNEICTR
jgi:hypothetical protein